MVVLALVPLDVYAAHDGPLAQYTSLDLTGKVGSYTASDGIKNADPTSEDITDSIEGWKWYLKDNTKKGYSAKPP